MVVKLELMSRTRAQRSRVVEVEERLSLSSSHPPSPTSAKASFCASFHVFHPLKDIKATLGFSRRTKGAVFCRRHLMETERFHLFRGWSRYLGLLWDRHQAA